VIVNKDDDDKFDEDFEVFKELMETELPMVPISVNNKRNFDKLKINYLKISDNQNLLKAAGKEPDLTKPFILKKGNTIEELAGKCITILFTA